MAKLTASLNMDKPERFTTLSPILDGDKGQDKNYGAFDGEVPKDNAGFIPKEEKRGEDY